MKRRHHWVGSVVLPVIVLLTGVGLAAWKYDAIQASQAASASQPEPMETVTVALAKEIEHRQTTTSIGTVLALRSITLRNELAGTVREVRLSPGQIVEPGMVLVALDVSVEEAELKAQEAQAALAKTVLDRRQNLNHEMATTQEEVDRARADLDKAIIARKTIRAPFRSRVGIADVHPGQYLNEGTLLTTLQGIDDAAHVDFTVAQQVAAGLREGEVVEVFAGTPAPITAKIVALDARIDPATRNAVVRARRVRQRAVPRVLGSRPYSGGRPAQGGCRSGQCIAQGPRRGSGVRDCTGSGWSCSRPCPAGRERRDVRRRVLHE
jgi:membrane fusion protein (multidrug efflux system)